MSINIGRTVLGGLIAGVVLNVGEALLNGFVLESQMKTFMASHNFADPGTNFMVIAVGLTFLMGIILVLSYAMIRPRLGPGVKTAIVAGFLGWFGVYFYCGIVNGVLFGIPSATICMVLAWGFVEFALAAIAGAWVYTEA